MGGRVTPREQVLGIIRERRGYDDLLTVPRAFIELTGDTDSALLLSQLLYWTERAASPQGWVYKSRDDWRLELGLNRYRLDRARRRLRDLGVLEEAHHLVGSRRILHLRPRCSDLCAALNAQPRDGGAGFRPRNRPAPAGTGVGGPSERPGMDRPDLGLPTVREFEDEPSERSSFDRSRTETTAETTPETPAETTASSSMRAKGEKNLRSTENGENRTGAPAPDSASGAVSVRDGPCESVCSAASAPGRHGSLPLREDTGSGPGRHGSLPLQEDTASAPAEDRLFDVLERVSGFPRDRDRAQLREVLADYPRVEHRLELKKFAAFYEKRTLDRPWFALRNWLERASGRQPHEPVLAASAVDPTSSGPPRPPMTPRGAAEPLPLGLVVRGPAYEALMRRKRAASAAVPPGSAGGRTAP